MTPKPTDAELKKQFYDYKNCQFFGVNDKRSPEERALDCLIASAMAKIKQSDTVLVDFEEQINERIKELEDELKEIKQIINNQSESKNLKNMDRKIYESIYDRQYDIEAMLLELNRLLGK